MSLPPKPCSHCGNLQFQVLPHMTQDVSTAMSLGGMMASKKVSGLFWTFTLVVCTGCGLTQMFTSNAAKLASRVEGSSVVNGHPR